MIKIAKHAGFCGGVKGAFNKAEAAIKNNPNTIIYTYGDLVHNNDVVKYFQNKGLYSINDINEFEKLDSSIVIIRSHGISKDEYNIISKNHEIIDATCKFVKKIHIKVEEFSNKGYNIVIIGDENHPEVKGICGWSSNNAFVVNDVISAKKLTINEPILVVAQTTIVEDKFNSIVNILKEKYSAIEIFNTICNATSQRQDAVKEISLISDYVIIIGGAKSSNTNKLFEIAKSLNNNAIKIENIDELKEFYNNDLQIFKNKIIGISAGASTPDWIIKEVVKTMNEVNGNEMSMEVVDNSFKRIHRGEVIKGEVLYVTEDEVMVNINFKSDGIITRDELSHEPVDPRTMFKQGDEIDVYVLKVDDGDGNVVLSYKRVMEQKIWDDLAVKYENKENVECLVLKPIKGGLSVQVEGLRGFMPASQVSLNYIEDFSVFKGETFVCRIIDFDKQKRRLVVSKKAIDREELDKKVEELWDSLEEGQLIKGTVQRLTDFGAFVDIGGVDGLIHISDLAWNRVRKPSDIVSVGDVVETEILSVDKERSRISLGLKQTMEEPWVVFEREVSVGDVVEGTVVSLLDFGAFIKLKQGVDGLLHVSQIANEHVEKPSDVLEIGQTVKVKVTEINDERRKISLSIRALLQDEAKELNQTEENVVEE